MTPDVWSKWSASHARKWPLTMHHRRVACQTGGKDFLTWLQEVHLMHWRTETTLVSHRRPVARARFVDHEGTNGMNAVMMSTFETPSDHVRRLQSNARTNHPAKTSPFLSERAEPRGCLLVFEIGRFQEGDST